MSSFLAMAMPILPGKEADWKKWRDELSTSRYNDFVASRKNMKGGQEGMDNMGGMGQ